MIVINRQRIETKFFPDGTPCLLNLPEAGEKAYITWQYNPKEFAHIVFILAHYSKRAKVIFSCPYLPNARMDRVISDNECFTLDHFMDIIGKYVDTLKVIDPHSDEVVNAAHRNGIENVVNEFTPVLIYAANALKRYNCDFICYPDKGAYDRYHNRLSILPAYQFYCEKKRNWKTGKIESVKISKLPEQELVNHGVLIVDDICSYGGTIDKCAEQMRRVGFSSVYVYVTHCENSVFDGHLLLDDSNIDGFSTTDSIERDGRANKIFYESKMIDMEM